MVSILSISLLSNVSEKKLKPKLKKRLRSSGRSESELCSRTCRRGWRGRRYSPAFHPSIVKTEQLAQLAAISK